VEITAVSSQNWPIALSQSTLTLNAGQSQSLTIDVTVPAGAVAGTIDATTITAASTNDAAATDTAVDRTTVHEATGIDLIVTDIQVSPATPAAGEEATVSVTIKNQGDVDVPFGNNFYLDFYVDREPLPFLIGDIQWGVQGVLLEAGASVTYDATYTFSGGAHELWAQVDTDDTVAEYPYDNNNIFGPEPLTVNGQQQPSEPASPFIYGPRSTPTPAPTAP
jgi:subtilase family serine protease